MTGSAHDKLRDLPPVSEILGLESLAPLIAARGRDSVREWVRAAVAGVRGEITAGRLDGCCDRSLLTGRVVAAVERQAEEDQSSRLGPVVNATGVVLHTSLGRAPLCDAALAAVREVAAASNLEIDLVTGERRYRGYQLQSAWRQLAGAEAALVVNNNAGATILALDALCRGREVIISRGQLIEIGGSFRLPDIFAQSGAVLREVGTTNRTHLSDYERAIGPSTAAILHVHSSNYRVIGFAEAPEVAALAPLAHQYGLTCIDDIGSGCLVDTTRFGLPHEPTFGESLAAGADLVLGSGDKLLGGPQCGILLGHAELIDRLSAHPLARALRIDKLTLAALAATLAVYLRGAAEREIPTLALLAATADELHRRAEAIAAEAAKGGDGAGETNCKLKIDVARDVAPVGGGSLPGAELQTAVLRLAHADLGASELARRLRLGTPRVFGRIHEHDVVLDLRSMLPADDARVVAALRGAGFQPAG